MKKHPPKQPKEDVLGWLIETYIPNLEQENRDLKRQLDNYFSLEARSKEIHSRWKKKMCAHYEDEMEE